MTVLYLVIPCYNESEVLPETVSRLDQILEGMVKSGKIDKKSRALYVNDGSKDNTWELIKGYSETSPWTCGLCLSRNRGHQNALLAGLMEAKKHADAVISLDADLQDDVNAIEKMVDAFHAGNDIVYGVRSSREKDTWFKKTTAEGFYHVMKFLGVEIVFNHADYRLMSRRALDGLEEFDEVNLFLRGIIPQIGYPSATVTYERGERFAGESKYPLKKMLAFAFEGITSFTIKPIRFVTTLGAFAFMVSLVMLVYCLVSYITGNVVSGWASLGVSIWALGGLQILSLGVIGEYIGKIYLETKHRPRYIVKETAGISDESV
ncbi:MAG: glycosyltransferase family 2 protein [Lachnospiraceae bacterium]|nr:glycosyltransferase family 2 protein [Lachnospiraceae bacterium]